MLPILVVEDNAINTDVALLQLKALGFPAESVQSGAAAVELVKKRSFSAILMDVMMPDMDGYEACRRIRLIEEEIGQRTPIIGVSAWAADDNKQQCFEAGMDDYIPKPYTRDDLKRVLDEWIQVAK